MSLGLNIIWKTPFVNSNYQQWKRALKDYLETKAEQDFSHYSLEIFQDCDLQLRVSVFDYSLNSVKGPLQWPQKIAFPISPDHIFPCVNQNDDFEPQLSR